MRKNNGFSKDMTFKEARDKFLATPYNEGSFTPYDSKTKRNECKNEGCTNARRHGSAYCESCSERHNRLKNNKQ